MAPEILLAYFLSALLLALALTPAVRRLALAAGAVDVPGERKIHTQPVPRLGGAAVLGATALVVAGALWLTPGLRPALIGGLGPVRWSILAAAALVILVLGSIDDVRGLSARFKLAVEIAAAGAVVLVAGAPHALELSPFAVHVDLGVAGPVLGILWIVAVTNAVNMSDGVDGMAAGLGSIAAVGLGVISLTLGNSIATTLLFALSGALLGFLPHNLRARKVFLGDAGSLGVGFVLGSASLVGLDRGSAWLAGPALLVLAVPLSEFTLTVLRRCLRALTVERADFPAEHFVLQRRSPGLFNPDRRHIHHRLLKLGLGPGEAVSALCLVGAVLGALGFAAVHWPWVGPVGGFAAAAGLIYFAPRALYEELRLLDRGAFLPLFESRLVRSRLLQGLYDASAVALAYLASEMVVRGPTALAQGGTTFWVRTTTVTATALLGFRLAGLYRAAYRHAGVAEALRAARAVVFGLVLGAGAFVAVFGTLPALSVWILHLYLVVTLVVGARLSFRLLDYLHQRGRHTGRRALIFGAGRGGSLALREILSNPALDLVPLGFVDDDPQLWQRQFQGFPVHAGQERLEPLLRSLNVDELIVATRKLSPARHLALAHACRNSGVSLVQFGLRWDEMAGDGVGEHLAPDLSMSRRTPIEREDYRPGETTTGSSEVA